PERRLDRARGVVGGHDDRALRVRSHGSKSSADRARRSILRERLLRTFAAGGNGAARAVAARGRIGYVQSHRPAGRLRFDRGVATLTAAPPRALAEGFLRSAAG